MQPGPSPTSFHAHVPLHNCTLHTSGCTTPLKSARAKPPSPSAPRAGRILRPDLERQPRRANRTVRQANPFPVMTLCPQRISLHRAQGESRRGADPGPSARQGGLQARYLPAKTAAATTKRPRVVTIQGRFVVARPRTAGLCNSEAPLSCRQLFSNPDLALSAFYATRGVRSGTWTPLRPGCRRGCGLSR